MSAACLASTVFQPKQRRQSCLSCKKEASLPNAALLKPWCQPVCPAFNLLKAAPAYWKLGKEVFFLKERTLGTSLR